MSLSIVERAIVSNHSISFKLQNQEKFKAYWLEISFYISKNVFTAFWGL